MSRGVIEREKSGFEELQSEAQRLLTGYPCIIQVHNSTPPEWQVSIVAGATKFFYQNADGSPEGEPYTDTELNVNITTGQTLAMRSDFPDRCVQRADTVIWVKVPGQNPVTYGASEQVAAGVCLRGKEYTLAPKEAVPFERLRSTDITDLFDLVPIR